MTKIITWLGRFLTIRQRRERALADFHIDHFLHEMDGLAPDLFIIDIELHAHIMAAYSLGKPVLLSSTWLSLWKHPRVPPAHTDYMPGKGILKYPWGNDWAWFKLRLWKLLRIPVQFLRSGGEDYFTLLLTLGKRLNFPVRQEIDLWQWLIPFMYRSLPVLSFNCEDLDFPHHPLPIVHYTGPLIMADRKGQGLEHEEAARLKYLLDQVQANDQRKLIYCAFGAQYQGDDRNFVKGVLSAARLHPDADFVIGLGGRARGDEFTDVPDNVHLFTWLPQPRVLKIADAAIIHGGASTVNECLYFGVPMLVYPFNATDILGITTRLDYHNLCLVGNRDEDTATQIASRLERLLSEKTIHQAVAHMQKRFRAIEAEHRLVRIVNTFL